MTIAPGHIIYRAHGEPRLVLVVSDLARVVTSSPEGRKATIRYARAGDCVGAVSVVTEWQEIMVEAVTEAEVHLNVCRLRHFARAPNLRSAGCWRRPWGTSAPR